MSTPLPAGFRYAGVACGIKASGKPDLALIVSDEPAVAAGVYTQNIVYAAPVELDRGRTPTDQFRVLAVNSGNANACTGERGGEDARKMAELAAESTGGSSQQALVMSTGVIGEFLPMNKIAVGLRRASGELSDSGEAFNRAADAFLTTDKGRKVGGRRFHVDRATITLAGIAKGAGMIGPKMATMLATVVTDAQLAPRDAQQVLAAAVDESFNCVSVEGHMSTNDTVLLLASGAIDAPPLQGESLRLFQQELTDLCIELAKMIPADGEGASHLIELEVAGCSSREAARQIARTVADSALVKTAITGGDPNWGRIVSAAGYAGVPFDPIGVALWINETLLYRQGAPVAFNAREVSQSIREAPTVRIQLQFTEGDAEATFWTSDLTIEYVKFNSEYHT